MLKIKNKKAFNSKYLTKLEALLKRKAELESQNILNNFFLTYNLDKVLINKIKKKINLLY